MLLLDLKAFAASKSEVEWTVGQLVESGRTSLDEERTMSLGQAETSDLTDEVFPATKDVDQDLESQIVN